MPDEPEEGFTVRDRRRVTGEPTAAATPAPTPPAPEIITPDDDETGDEDGYFGGEEGGEGGELPDVYSVLALFLGELRNMAWLRMGLVANPATGQIERDMGQAQVAIDTVAFLAKQLEGVVAPEERVPLKALVSDLQVNFVEQTKRSA